MQLLLRAGSNEVKKKAGGDAGLFLLRGFGKNLDPGDQREAAT
jgi:hypothetical protein